jgi:hypothetical protein
MWTVRAYSKGDNAIVTETTNEALARKIANRQIKQGYRVEITYRIQD